MEYVEQLINKLKKIYKVREKFYFYETVGNK